MKIALFGGTFNPVHNGHVKLIKEADKEFDFDKIIIMPDKIPPHKEAVCLADENDRINMCRLAFCDNEKVTVSNYEFTREGKSYSINTIRHLISEYENSEIFLVIGSDMFTSFHTWKEYKEILKLVTIIAAARNENDIAEMNKYVEEYPEMKNTYKILLYTPFDISSTEIRNLISAKSDYSCYLPQKVVKYILDNNLYK